MKLTLSNRFVGFFRRQDGEPDDLSLCREAVAELYPLVNCAQGALITVEARKSPFKGSKKIRVDYEYLQLYHNKNTFTMHDRLRDYLRDHMGSPTVVYVRIEQWTPEAKQA